MNGIFIPKIFLADGTISIYYYFPINLFDKIVDCRKHSSKMHFGKSSGKEGRRFLDSSKFLQCDMFKWEN